MFQRSITGRLALTDEFFSKKLAVADHHLDNWRAATGSLGLPLRVLELGTGWHPVVPIALALRGVEDVVTVDLAPLFGDEQIVETLLAFRNHLDDQPDSGAADAAARVDDALRIQSGNGLDRLRSVGVRSVTSDASTLALEPRTIDLFVSANTLEHIPATGIEAVLRSLRPAMSEDGVSSHLIDLADHYSGFDPGITPYHFLRYSSRKWAWFNNDLQFQNRLRQSQYRALFDDAGWHIVSEKTESDLAMLKAEPIHKEFTGFELDDLAVHTSWVVHRPEPSA